VPLATIDEVLAALDVILDTCRKRGSASGYFAAMYRRVTAEVQRRIVRGDFDDGPRMTRFDVVFAQRYLDASVQHERGERLTAVWGAAFGAAQRWRPVVLQHLLVGMNAHINLDLGIVAAETASGAAIAGLKRDFDTINRILAEQVDDMQDRMASIWPAVRWLDRVAGPVDEAVINFSIRRAREQAWRLATTLAEMTDEAARRKHIDLVNTAMTALAGRVLAPGVKLATTLAVIRLRERGGIAEKIDVLLRP
jgi:hypothetical protein